MILIKSKSHHTQSIKTKLLFGHAQILETQCYFTIIKTYESTVSILQLYNLYISIIQFFKVESLPFTTYFGKSPHMDCILPAPLKTKKGATPL